MNSDDMVFNIQLYVICSPSGTKHKKHDLSETSSVSDIRLFHPDFRSKTDPVSETLCSFRIPNERQSPKPGNLKAVSGNRDIKTYNMEFFVKFFSERSCS
jgi:hypothetical protein